MNSKDILISSIENIYEEESNRSRWEGSPFQKLTSISNDTRGKWGEQIISEHLCHIEGSTVEWSQDQNINQNDGIYDIKLNINRDPDVNITHRIEVKTSIFGITNTWQHENIYASKVWDKLIFVDVYYNGIYFTVLGYDEFNFFEKHHVFNRKPCLRNKQTDKYKFDFSIKNLENGIKNNLTLYYDIDKNNSEELIEFFVNRLT